MFYRYLFSIVSYSRDRALLSEYRHLKSFIFRVARVPADPSHPVVCRVYAHEAFTMHVKHYAYIHNPGSAVSDVAVTIYGSPVHYRKNELAGTVYHIKFSNLQEVV